WAVLLVGDLGLAVHEREEHLAELGAHLGIIEHRVGEFLRLVEPADQGASEVACRTRRRSSPACWPQPHAAPRDCRRGPRRRPGCAAGSPRTTWCRTVR